MIMKIPLTPLTNGYYGNGNANGEFGFDGDHNSSTPSPHQDMDSPTLDGDFSEYMWMENEEEFDKQVMQQLEEEALMEQCIEAMLEDEREAQQAARQAAWSSANDISSELCVDMSGLRVAVEDVTHSTLNPLAAEFVPGMQGSAQDPSSLPVVTANS